MNYDGKIKYVAVLDIDRSPLEKLYPVRLKRCRF